MELAGGPQSPPSPSTLHQQEQEQEQGAQIPHLGPGHQHSLLAPPAAQARGREPAGACRGLPSRPRGPLISVSSGFSVHSYRHFLVIVRFIQTNLPLPQLAQDLSIHSLALHNKDSPRSVTTKYLHPLWNLQQLELI